MSTSTDTSLTQKTLESKPGVYFGVPDNNFTSKGMLQQTTPEIKTMRQDALLAKKEHEGRALFAQKEVTPSSNILSTLLSQLSGKAKREKEEQIKKDEALKEQIEKEKKEAEALAEKKRLEKLKLEHEQSLIAENLAKNKAVVDSQQRATTENIPQAQNRVIIKEESKIAPSPEATAVKNRIAEVAGVRAAEIIATRDRELSNVATRSAEIIEEKEKIRATVDKIVKDEERALAEVIKIIEREEIARAEIAKTKASEKRALTEKESEEAEANLLKANEILSLAEQAVKKAREEATAATIEAKAKKDRAEQAAKIEAQEIFRAEKNIQIAVDAATAEVAALQKKAREEAALITLVQEETRKAEAAEIQKLLPS